jgi:hypothetical protein
MKYIHYDAEGDILSVTFAESKGQTHKGVELSDNIVFYYNPETRKPLGLVLLSYRALLQASTLTPIPPSNGSCPSQSAENSYTLITTRPRNKFLSVDRSTGRPDKPLE